jgi:hypothetical protein
VFRQAPIWSTVERQSTFGNSKPGISHFALDEPFIFSDKLKLWVLPFDLEKGRLSGGGLANLPLIERCAGAA